MCSHDNGGYMNIANKIVIPIILFGVFFCSFTNSFAQENGMKYYTKPKNLMTEISKRGASTIVNELYSDTAAWNFVLNNIAKGNPAWLDVAVALHSGSDAGASEMLTLSVGEALEVAPENVLRLTLNEFKLEFLCSGPDVDDKRYNSYELSLATIKTRQDRLSVISEPALKNIAVKCIELLEKSKDSIAKFYGINKKSD